MLRYPGTSYNVYHEQVKAYTYLQKKISQAKLKKGPYCAKKENMMLPTIVKENCCT